MRRLSDCATRLGLFGGTFDPVHFGHLRSAVELAEHYRLDTLYLVPNHRPVHRDAPLASTDARIDMLERALQGVDGIAIDPREALRDRPSWTVETLAAVHAEQPDATLLFFMGVDAFAVFDRWHEWERILTLCNLVVVDRPEAEWSVFARQLLARQQQRVGATIQDGQVGVIERAEVTALSISASDIRRRAAAGLSLRYLVPETVRLYIHKHGLYPKVAS